MRKIDTSTWKAFHVTDFFTVLSRRNKLSKVDIDDGNTPVYSSNSFNGGIFGYTTKEPDYEISEDIPFYITFGDHTKAVNIADKSFCVMDNVKVLTTKIRNYNVLHFIITSWLKNVPNLGYARHWSIAEKAKIYLPATSDGQPDWNYMESYMKAVMKESEASLESLKQADEKKTAVDISGWKEFVIGDLFDKLNLGIKNPQFNKALDVSEEQTDEFNLPLVNAKHGNNGIMFYGRKEDFETASMTIDIVQNGAIATGDVYAQPQETGVLWDAYLIKPKHEIKSEYMLMFLAVVIERAIKERFSYDDKCVWDKASLLKVKLPVDSHGCPDWAYMDAYMQGVMQKSELCINRLKQAFV